jgi:heme exporter protein C
MSSELPELKGRDHELKQASEPSVGERTESPQQRRPTASKPAATGTPATRVVGVAALIGLAWLVAFGLAFSPADYVQQDAVRIMYVHVPMAWLAFLSFGVTALCSVIYLSRPDRSLIWDRFAGASAEIGVLFTAVALVTGSLWGRLTWGVYWRWDALLTTTAFMFVTYIGYLAVRNLGGTHRARAKRSAVLGIVASLEIPLVHFSVNWWRTLHQKATIDPLNRTTISGLMLFSLLVGVVAFTLVYAWLLMHRQRVLAMRDAVEVHGLDRALEERRSEGASR